MAETASDAGSNNATGKSGSVSKLKQRFSSMSKTKKILSIVGFIAFIVVLIVLCAIAIGYATKSKSSAPSQLLSDIGKTSNSAANTDSQLSPSRSPAGVKVANVSFLSENGNKKESSLAKKKKSSLSKPGSSGLKVDSSLRIQNMLGVKDVRLVNAKSSNLVEDSTK